MEGCKTKRESHACPSYTQVYEKVE